MTSLAATESLPGRPARPHLAVRLMLWIEQSHVRVAAALLVLCLAGFLPGFISLQPMDRDEPRYAQASKQMLESGEFVDIRFQGEARHKKPIGIYWLQSATVAMAEALGVPDARTTIAVYRIPSLLGAIATVWLTYWAALAFLSRHHAALAAAFMASSVILMVEARLAKTDAVLTACSVAAMGALARAYVARTRAGVLPRRTIVVFWSAMAAGILVKGPLILMFTGLASIVLSIRERSGRWLLALEPLKGAALTLAIVLPWFIAIAVKSGGSFYAESVGHDMLGKVGTAQTQHWAPPGFYLVAFFATFWPAAILAAIAVPFAWINRREDVVAFALAWVLPSWLVFEAVPTKLPHYVMPLYPAIAIVTVLAIARRFVSPKRPGAVWAALLLPFIPVGITIGLSAAGWILDEVVLFAALPLLVAACILAGLGWNAFRVGAVGRAALLGVVASVALSSGALGLAQPLLRALKLSPRLAEVAQGIDCPDLQVATLGYREPSLVFLVGTGLRMLDTPDDAAQFLAAGGCRLAYVERRFEPEFLARAAALNLQPGLSTRVAGFNINSGRRVEIGAYSVTP